MRFRLTCIFALLAALLSGAIAFSLASGQDVGPVHPSPQAPHVKAPLPRPAYLPDPKLTPGIVLNTDAKAVCERGYAGKVRAVSVATRREVFRRYGLESVPLDWRPYAYEVDHLISLELGGSNDLSNLWPEPRELVVNGRKVGAEEKDRAEDATHRAVCKGEIGLREAQKQISSDWTVLYRRFVSPEFPKANPEVKAGLRLRPRTHHSLIADIDSGVCSDPERHIEEAVGELVGRKASLGDGGKP
jgi:hypothetical protein